MWHFINAALVILVLALLARDAGKQRAASALLEAWKIAPADLWYGEARGGGGQADVFAGRWQGLPVAIKRARGGDAQLRALVQELRSTNRLLSGLFWAVIGFVLGVLLAWLTARFLGIGL